MSDIIESGPAVGRITPEARRVLLWVCAVIAVNQLAFGIIVPVVPLYTESFGVSKSAIGLTIATYGLARFLTNMPTGALADRYGRRWTLTLGGAITLSGNFLCAAATSYWVLLAGRFIAGAGAAVVITTAQIVVADISEPANRGRMMSIYMATFLFAVGIGPLPGGLLAEHVSLSAPFIACALLGGVVGVLAWWRMPETRPESLSAVSREGGAARVTASRARWELATSRAFVLISMVSFCTFFARTGALFALIPTMGEDKLGLSAGEIGLGLSAISIVGLGLAYPSGVLVDRFGRKAVIVPSLVLHGLATLLFLGAGSYAGFLLACSVWASASGLASSGPTAYAADIAPPGRMAATMGTYRMLADFGYVVGPIALGLIADARSTEFALFLTAVLLVAAGVAFALLAPETYRRRRPEPSELAPTTATPV